MTIGNQVKIDWQYVFLNQDFDFDKTQYPVIHVKMIFYAVSIHTSGLKLQFLGGIPMKKWYPGNKSGIPKIFVQLKNKVEQY